MFPSDAAVDQAEKVRLLDELATAKRRVVEDLAGLAEQKELIAELRTGGPWTADADHFLRTLEGLLERHMTSLRRLQKELATPELD